MQSQGTISVVTTAPSQPRQRDGPVVGPSPDRHSSLAGRSSPITPHSLLLAAILLLATAIRVPHLALVPRFTDEAWEVLWSLPIVRGEEFPLTNFNTFKGALANYLVAGSFLLLGPSALAARLVSLVAGVLTVLATYGLARSWAGPRAGLLAAGLLALNPAHIVINSHIAWSHSLTPLFTTLAIWALSAGTRRRGDAGTRGRSEAVSESPRPRVPAPPRPWLIATSGLLWGLAFQTHPSAAAFLPAAAAYLLWRRPRMLATPWPYLALVAFLLGSVNLVAYNLLNGPQSFGDAGIVRRNYEADQAAATSYPAALASELLLTARVLGGAIDARSAPWGYVLDLPVLLGSGLALAGLAYLARRGSPLPLWLSVSFLALLPAVNPKFNTLVHSRFVMPLAPVLLATLAAFLAPRLMPLRFSFHHRDRGDRRESKEISALSAVNNVRRLAVPVAAAILLLGPLPSLFRYYDQIFASRDTNERAYQLAGLIAQHRDTAELVVLDEAFGSESGDGDDELRALRFLLAFQDAPVRVMKITPKRLEDELDDAPGLLVVLNGRQLRDFGRLSLEPLTAIPQRGSEAGLFRLSARPHLRSGLRPVRPG